MPNGAELNWYHFWHAEEPLRDIDVFLEHFAKSAGASVRRNYRGYPSRDIMAERLDGVHCSIRIHPIPAKRGQKMTKRDYVYVFALVAGKNIDRQSYGWHRCFRRFKKLPKDKTTVFRLLKQSWKKLQSVQERDLKPMHYYDLCHSKNVK